MPHKKRRHHRDDARGVVATKRGPRGGTFSFETPPTPTPTTTISSSSTSKSFTSSYSSSRMHLCPRGVLDTTEEAKEAFGEDDE